MSAEHEDELEKQRARVSARLCEWGHLPAILLDRHLDVLCSSALASALSPSFQKGTNLARFTFLEPHEARETNSFRAAAAQIAGMLNDSLEQHHPDAGFLSIVGELSAKSRAFSQEWAKESIGAEPAGVTTFINTAVGDITLGYSLVRIPKNNDDTLLMFCSLDDETDAALAQLNALIAASATSAASAASAPAPAAQKTTGPSS